MVREITKKAIDWIQRLNNSNFFLAVGFILPHLSRIAPEEFFDKHGGNGHVSDNKFVPNDFASATFSRFS